MGLKIDSELKTNLINRLTLWARDPDSDRGEAEKKRERKLTADVHY